MKKKNNKNKNFILIFFDYIEGKQFAIAINP